MNQAFVIYMICTYYKALFFEKDTELTPSEDMIHMS